MGYIIIADSLITDSIRRDSLLGSPSIEPMDLVLSGDIPFYALEFTQHGNQLLIANQPVWYFILLFFLVAAIAVSQLFFGKLLKGSFQAAVRYSITVGMFNDNSLVQRQKDIILDAVYFVSLAFFILMLEIRFSLFPFRIAGFPLFLSNIIFLVAIFYLKIFFVNLIAHIFNKTKLYQEYLYHNFTVNKLFGLLLVPLIFFLAYTREPIHDVSFYATISLFVATVAMKITKGIVFSLKKHVFSFYLFLYLCALEIVPILLIYKLITTVV
jgi:hypothetical protein